MVGIVSLGIFDEVAVASFCEVFWALLLDTLEVEVDLVRECAAPSDDKVRAWDPLLLLAITPALLLTWDFAFSMLGLEIVFSDGLLTVDTGADLAGSADRLFWSWGLGTFVFTFLMELVRFNDLDLPLVSGVLSDFVLGWVAFIGTANFLEEYEME